MFTSVFLTYFALLALTLYLLHNGLTGLARSNASAYRLRRATRFAIAVLAGYHAFFLVAVTLIVFLHYLFA